MPPIAAMMHATGSVKVLVDLDESGKLKGTSVLASSGNAALDRAALETVRESEFSPEKIDCQGVAGSYAVIVDFPE
jgi:TonB family protein